MLSDYKTAFSQLKNTGNDLFDGVSMVFCRCLGTSPRGGGKRNVSPNVVSSLLFLINAKKHFVSFFKSIT